MDFARKQLEKYGWNEGEGLGKNRNGISKAIKPKLKFDNAGLGHDVAEEFDNPWWQRLYNEAANNIVTNERNEIELKGESVVITTRKRKRKSGDKSRKYNGFVKTAELKGTTEKNFENVQIDEVQEVELPGVTNDELFKICGGRTAHKGARHGLKMSAKLARIVEQEKRLMAVKSDVDDNNLRLKKKKKDKKKSHKHKDEV